MKNKISNVMDAVIMNKNMHSPGKNRVLYNKICPEWAKPVVTQEENQ
jgi:hypothetical protein